MADAHPGPGDPAPDFTLPSDEGGEVTLSALSGRKVLLYFYPKDDTSGCTRQACDLRDEMPRFESADVLVLGVSPDPIDSHRDFNAKYGLGFPLLSDEDHSIADAYGVWKEKSMFGRRYMGIERSTFLIDENGTIEAAWRRVKPDRHAERALAHFGL